MIPRGELEKNYDITVYSYPSKTDRNIPVDIIIIIIIIVIIIIMIIMYYLQQ